MNATTQRQSDDSPPDGQFILTRERSIISLTVASQTTTEVAKALQPIRYAVPINGLKQFVVITDERDSQIQAMCIVNMDIEPEKPIHQFRKCGLPAISVSTGRIAWIAQRGPSDRPALYLASLNDLANPQVINGPFVVDSTGPQWNGENSLILGCDNESIGQFDLGARRTSRITAGILPVVCAATREVLLMRGRELWARSLATQSERLVATCEPISDWYRAIQVSPNGRFACFRTLVLPPGPKPTRMHKLLGMQIVDLENGLSTVVISGDTEGPWAWIN